MPDVDERPVHNGKPEPAFLQPATAKDPGRLRGEPAVIGATLDHGKIGFEPRVGSERREYFDEAGLK